MRGTRTYLNSASPRLSERDFAIIETVGRFKIAASEHIEVLHFSEVSERSRARSRQFVLKRLVEHKMLRRVGQRAIGGADGGSTSTLYCLDKAGLEVAALTSAAPRRKYVDFKPHVAHTLAILETYCRLKQMEQAGKLTVAAYDAEPHCWRTFGSGQVLKPGAFIRLRAEHQGRSVSASFFLEFDRNQEWGARIESKVPTYLAYKDWDSERRFPHVLFLAPTAQRVGYLQRLVASQAGVHAGSFKVGLVEDFEAMLGL